MTEDQNRALVRLKQQGYVEAPAKGDPLPPGGNVRVRAPDGRFWLIKQDGSLQEEGK